MKVIRTISLVLVLLFAITMLSGCHKIEAQQKVDRMLDYINAKYTDDSFAFKSMFGGYLGSNVTKIIVNSEQYPNDDIYVICTEKDSQETFTDNYLGVKFAKETKTELETLISNCFGNNFYVNYLPSNLACTINGSDDMTFEEYVSEASSHISFGAIVEYKVDDEQEDIVFQKVKKEFSNITAIGRIYFVDNIDFSGCEGRELFESYIEDKKYYKKLYFFKTDLDEFSAVEWTDGV